MKICEFFHNQFEKVEKFHVFMSPNIMRNHCRDCHRNSPLWLRRYKIMVGSVKSASNNQVNEIQNRGGFLRKRVRWKSLKGVSLIFSTKKWF